MKQLALLTALMTAAVFSGKAQLIINELSQGPTGNKEYVELLVTGNPTCNSANTVDLRGWVIDDNNSWHGTGSGTGIAAGHVRFSYSSIWANVKIGTLILVYNDADVSTATSALVVDSTDANNDCVYVLPISSPALDRNTTLPANAGSMTTYAGATYGTAGTWTILGMANGDDAFHTVSPANYTVAYHSIGWGNASNALNVYYPGSQSGMVIYMANLVSNDPFDAANFIDTTASTSETPGAPNNSANAAWIASLNHNCSPFTAPTVTVGSPLQLTCANTAVTITASTNTGGAIYQWSSGNQTASDTVTAAGTYYITVSDAGGICSTIDSVSVTANTIAPDASVTGGPGLGCGITADTLIATSVTPNATYNWGNGNTTTQYIVSASGTYTVTVTNPANGCTATAGITVNNAGNLIIAVSTTNATCGTNNGTAHVSATTGTASGYIWNNSETTATISGLAAGSYTVTVTGTNGCTVAATATINSVSAAGISTSSTPATCGVGNGTAAATISGGTATAYLWSNSATTDTITGVAAGIYNVTVTDNNGCIITASVTVNNAGAAVLSASSTPATCGTDNGTATVTATSGTATGYVWNNAGTTATISGLAPGNYTVTVTDNNGCTGTASATVGTSGNLGLTATASATTCGLNNGTATVAVIAGTATGYSWNNSETTATITGLAAGTYTVTVTGANNCSGTASATVTGSNAPNTTVTSATNIICAGDSVQICAQGSFAAYTWNTGATSPCIQARLAGNYYVTVTDNSGCTATSNHLAISVYPQPPVSITVKGDTLISFNAVSYQWLLNGTPINGANNGTYVATATGSYSLQVTDTNGCRATSNPVNITISGIQQLNMDRTISVYPNPSTDGRFILNAGAFWQYAHAELFDVAGRVIFAATITQPQTELQNFDMPAGVYMLRIKNESSTMLLKLIKGQ